MGVLSYAFPQNDSVPGDFGDERAGLKASDFLLHGASFGPSRRLRCPLVFTHGSGENPKTSELHEPEGDAAAEAASHDAMSGLRSFWKFVNEEKVEEAESQ